MRKRTFLLLEVLMAFTLIALCAVPLMKFPIQHLQQQVEALSSFEKQRLAGWTFSEVKELLLKEAIPWKKLPGPKDPVLKQLLPDASLTTPPFPAKPVSRGFLIKCKGEKEGTHGELHRIMSITILLDDQEISPKYRVIVTLVEKKGSS